MSFKLCGYLAWSSLALLDLRLNAQGTDSLPRHAIVFAHHSDAARKDYDIWQMAADGSQMASVLVLPMHQSQFTISPNGDELIYVDTLAGNRDFYRRHFHGGTPINITESAANEGAPRWSPDGTKLLFSSDQHSDKQEIYVRTLDSDQVIRLTENQFFDSDGCWAPDGSAVLFSRFFPGDDKAKSAGHGAIVEYDLESQQERQLTDLGGYCGGVDYSPDGKKIAFHRVADGTSELWVMNSDGSEQKQMTASFVDEYSPAWSPDGNWIAYTAGTGNDGSGTFDLWLMRSDGSDSRLISAAANTQMSPRWRTGEHFLK